MKKMYEDLQSKGLNIIAVNYQARDKMEDIVKYVTEEQKFGFPVVLGGAGEAYTLGEAYGVMAYPTNYLVDSNGTILWRKVGFNEKDLVAELEKLGIK